ncbi:Protein of unknown function [Gryllus bimaculatus]|nr:Protein of unknown function [Gryllus bimaculatus]
MQEPRALPCKRLALCHANAPPCKRPTLYHASNISDASQAESVPCGQRDGSLPSKRLRQARLPRFATHELCPLTWKHPDAFESNGTRLAERAPRDLLSVSLRPAFGELCVLTVDKYGLRKVRSP